VEVWPRDLFSRSATDIACFDALSKMQNVVLATSANDMLSKIKVAGIHARLGFGPSVQL
jgi:hypothetical protein